MFFRGTLRFDDGDAISVERLIVRDSDVAFDWTATWNGTANWKVSAVATKTPDGTWVSRTLAKQFAKSFPCVITFLELDQPQSSEMEVSGLWSEGGNEYPFGGVLRSSEYYARSNPR